MSFKLHPTLAADCFTVGELELCTLLMLNDQRYPWFILVPRRDDVSEVFQLQDAEQQQLWRESAQLSQALKASFSADKINIGALGNLVPQLHIHHVARFTSDPAWPGPVWGHSAAEPYSSEKKSQRLRQSQEWFLGMVKADFQ